MGANELCNALMGIISEETSLLERVATLELTLKQSVVSHDWRALERARAKMAPIFRRLADVEQARAASFEA
ncbi:MAG TPA: hypothetical protein VMV68_03965, partial [Spirochaetia bacterium]|nr:hypothetical protein [Spirochaetia bacterium]